MQQHQQQQQHQSHELREYHGGGGGGHGGGGGGHGGGGGGHWGGGGHGGGGHWGGRGQWGGGGRTYWGDYGGYGGTFYPWYNNVDYYPIYDSPFIPVPISINVQSTDTTSKNGFCSCVTDEFDMTKKTVYTDSCSGGAKPVCTGEVQCRCEMP